MRAMVVMFAAAFFSLMVLSISTAEAARASASVGFVFTYIAPDQTVLYDIATGEGQFVEGLVIAEDPDNPLFPTDIHGFAMGIAHDPTFLVATQVEQAPVLSETNGGAGVDFFTSDIFTDGITVGVVINFQGLEVLQLPEPAEVILVTYETQAAILEGQPGTVTDLIWSDALGQPPVRNLVVARDASIPALVDDGEIELIGIIIEPNYIRGNCNDDASVDIADGVFILNFLFHGGASPGCMEACDANDDGLVNAADATYLFTYQLLGGPPPPAPFPDCGDSPGDDCEEMTASCPAAP